MTKAVLRSGIIVCSLMTFGTGVSIGQDGLVSQEKASSPPISQAGRYVYLIPQSAHSLGNLGSNWRTDAVLHNGGLNEATAWIYYLKADTDNSSAEGTKVTVAAHSSVKLPDVVKNLFAEERSAGALLVGSDQELVITSRTYNDDPKGTFGQYVEGYHVPYAIGAKEKVRLIGLAENANRRTNIGFANGTGKTLDILVVMFKANGTKIGEKTYQVPPYGFIKRDKILKLEFGAGDVDDAFAVISSSTPGAMYFTYASVIDNLSNDPVCIIPVGRMSQPHLTEDNQTSANIEPADTASTNSSKVTLADSAQSNKVTSLHVSDSWERIGPSGVNVRSLVIDPMSRQTVYAGTDHGVFKTNNGGLSWREVGLLYYINVVAIDPTHPHTIYAGTGGNGIFKSTNGGETWLRMDSGLSDSCILTMAIDPSDVNTLYAGSSRGGVFKSANGGISWIEINSGLPSPRTEVKTLAIDPTNSQIIYAGTDGSGVFKTNNGGSTWNAVNAGLSRLSVEALGIDPSNSLNLYAGTAGGGVFKSANGGLSWSAVSIGLSNLSVIAIAIDPNSPKTIYVGTGHHGVWKSINGGADWVASGVFSHSWISTIAIDPLDSKTIFAGIIAGRTVNNGGIFRSTDASESWVEVSTGLHEGSRVSTLALDTIFPQTIYAVVDEGVGVLIKSSDGGDSWVEVNIPESIVDINILAIDPKNSLNIYMGTLETRGGGYVFGVYKTINGGESWGYLEGCTWGVLSITLDPSNPQNIYIGSYCGVDKSLDGGGSWKAIGTGLPAEDYSGVKALVVDPHDSGTVYAGTLRNGVFKSLNGGDLWTAANLGISNSQVHALAIDPNNTQTLFAATFRELSPYKNESRVFKSTDGGQKWNDIGLTNCSIRSIAVDPADPQIVYAVGGRSVFRSTDGGASWTQVNTGLPDEAVSSLAIGPKDPKTVFVGTDGEGIFKKTFAPCRYSLGRASASFNRNGGTVSIEVSTNECSWSAVSNDSWITITDGALSAGNGRVSIEVAANMSGNSRTGRLTIAGQTFTVEQSGACGPPVEPALTAPGTALSGRAYTLSWTKNSAIDSYEVQESRSSDFAGAISYAVTGTKYTTTHIALAPTVYYSRVQAIDVCDGQTYISEWSATAATIVSPGEAIFLPAAAHTQGLADTNWRTDLEIHNPGATKTSFAIVLLAKDLDNTAPMSNTYFLASNQSQRYPDVLASLFSFTGSATLCIVSNESSLMATSRTYNLLTAGNKLDLPEGATFGQFIPGKSDTQAIQYGQTGRLIQLSQSVDETAGSRTNIGITSVVAIPITIEIKLFKGDGTYVTTRTVDLAPFGYTQINTIFANVIGSTMDDGFAEVRTMTPGGRFFAYASVTDNKSGDPIYIPAVVR